MCHLIVTNKLEECVITIPSPFDPDYVIDLYMTLDEDTKNDVNFVNNAPYISSKIKLTSKILSADKSSNYFKEDNLKLIEEYANSYMKAQVEDYLYTISKDYNSDIALFR